MTTVDPTDKPIATLVIVQYASGQVNVTGPIANKMGCYGLLEVARDIISRHDPAKAAAEAPIILPARNGMHIKP